MEPNLAAHIEKHPEVWCEYVNDKEFLDMAMNNATKAEQEEAAERRRMRKLTAGLRKEGGISGRDSSSEDEDDDGGVDERKMPDVPYKGGDESSEDSEEGLDEAFAALESPRDPPELRRRDTVDALSKGIPGFYEDFSYQDARKVLRDLERNEAFVKQQLKLGLARRMLNRTATEKIEKEIEDGELDRIFNLDLRDAPAAAKEREEPDA